MGQPVQRRATAPPLGAAPKPAKVPIRTCVGCQTERPRKELVRVVRTPDGQVLLDRAGKIPGRGAYVCPSRACLEMAVKKKRLARTLRTAVSDEVITQVEQWLDG